ncbi:MAG: transcriptional regulator, TetR family [Neobacillus sp.]|jgi:AcrR family transcriptional regulator|nr:transcriptional regulator, TetR family [Neobacillus sp.]
MTKKEEILNETFTLFCQSGYNLSVTDIAIKVNIKPPSLYSHFDSKDDIIEQLVKIEIDNFFHTLSDIFQLIGDAPSLTYKQKFQYIFWNILKYYDNIEHLLFWRNIFLIDNELLREKCWNMLREREKPYYKMFVTLFDQAAKHHEIKASYHEGHLFLFITMIQGLLNALVMYHTIKGMRDFAEKTWDAYWDSIKVD